jgi:hypothetical protein
MLARRLTTILPAMTLAEAIETTRIHSVAGLIADRTAVVTTCPCRTLHHTMAEVGLIGGIRCQCAASGGGPRTPTQKAPVRPWTCPVTRPGLRPQQYCTGRGCLYRPRLRVRLCGRALRVRPAVRSQDECTDRRPAAIAWYCGETRAGTLHHAGQPNLPCRALCRGG